MSNRYGVYVWAVMMMTACSERADFKSVLETKVPGTPAVAAAGNETPPTVDELKPYVNMYAVFLNADPIIEYARHKASSFFTADFSLMLEVEILRGEQVLSHRVVFSADLSQTANAIFVSRQIPLFDGLKLDSGTDLTVVLRGVLVDTTKWRAAKEKYQQLTAAAAVASAITAQAQVAAAFAAVDSAVAILSLLDVDQYKKSEDYKFTVRIAPGVERWLEAYEVDVVDRDGATVLPQLKTLRLRAASNAPRALNEAQLRFYISGQVVALPILATGYTRVSLMKAKGFLSQEAKERVCKLTASDASKAERTVDELEAENLLSGAQGEEERKLISKVRRLVAIGKVEGRRASVIDAYRAYANNAVAPSAALSATYAPLHTALDACANAFFTTAKDSVGKVDQALAILGEDPTKRSDQALREEDVKRLYALVEFFESDEGILFAADGLVRDLNSRLREIVGALNRDYYVPVADSLRILPPSEAADVLADKLSSQTTKCGSCTSRHRPVVDQYEKRVAEARKAALLGTDAALHCIVTKDPTAAEAVEKVREGGCFDRYRCLKDLAASVDHLIKARGPECAAAPPTGSTLPPAQVPAPQSG
jgi:hypothetical protein